MPKTAIKKRFAKLQDLNESEYEILHTKIYFFFGYYIHPHQKLLAKKKHVLFVDENFNFSLFSRVLRVKNSMPIPFP